MPPAAGGRRKAYASKSNVHKDGQAQKQKPGGKWAGRAGGLARGQNKEEEEEEAATAAAAAVSEKPERKAGSTLLQHQTELSRKPEKPLTKGERIERNRRISALVRKEELYKHFGRARDRDVKPEDWIDPEAWEDPRELAPTRSKRSRQEENLAKLTAKNHELTDNVMQKALMNFMA
eukprot:TRINITY_DN117472_c0_g1_i1.p1 TRINITY_DN117472_c0_g1~~TRINITY_DN117472_c0_g1_i1.p1  ORF type:complete len:177 (-),score=45.42 TRINITY_DN117472_c0_g1_i1:14-544(-)